MKIGIGLACFFSLLSCLGHFYLAKRAYQLSAGLAEKSAICHISENINCDQALLSPYAKIFDFSISDFGFALKGKIVFRMKIGIGLACFFSLLSCLGHFYLAKRAYQLSAGLAEKSAICHISENINCDQALLSPYAKIFDFSISDFGFAFNLAVFLLILFAIQ